MTEIPVKAIETFGATGGILGLVVLLLVGFMVWYIHTSRKYHATENAALAEERKEWRSSLDRNTEAFHELSRSLGARPCLRSADSRTRSTD